MNSTTSSRPFRVIIVGAGVAGLSCAETLLNGARIRNFPIELCILEGRDRIGGRCHTVETKDGALVDLGASWIHGYRGNPISELADKYQVKLTSPVSPFQPWSERVFDSSELDRDMTTLVKDYLEAVFFKAESQEEDMSIHNAIQKYGYHDLIETLQKKYQKELEGKDPKSLDRLFWLKVKNFEGYNGGASKKLSAKHFVDLYFDFPGGDRFIVGGYENIPKGIARSVKEKGGQIVISRTVEKISFDSKTSQVTVSGVQTGSTTNRFEVIGDCVVVTVPLGVLKSPKIQFEPPLPQWKSNCIQRMGMGLLGKVFLSFRESFWNPNDEWIGYASENYLDYRAFLNCQYYTGGSSPLLLAFVHNEFAKELETLPDEEVFQRALKVLSECYGEKVFGLFKHGIVTRWNSDPFALGAYSYMAVGSSGEDFKLLGKPLTATHTFFAGEATSRQHLGTVHGACLSGRREADRIMQMFFPPIVAKL